MALREAEQLGGRCAVGRLDELQQPSPIRAAPVISTARSNMVKFFHNQLKSSDHVSEVVQLIFEQYDYCIYILNKSTDRHIELIH